MTDLAKTPSSCESMTYSLKAMAALRTCQSGAVMDRVDRNTSDSDDSKLSEKPYAPAGDVGIGESDILGSYFHDLTVTWKTFL